MSSSVHLSLWYFLLFIKRQQTKLQQTIAHFDNLIEEAAELPRMYGYAPKTSEMFKNEGLRKAAREKQFKEMDVKAAGYITLSQWIHFAIEHILKKYVQLPKDYLSSSAADVSKE